MKRSGIGSATMSGRRDRRRSAYCDPCRAMAPDPGFVEAWGSRAKRTAYRSARVSVVLLRGGDEPVDPTIYAADHIDDVGFAFGGRHIARELQ